MKMIIFISVILIMNGCSKHSRVQKEISIQRYIFQNEITYDNVYKDISNEIERMKKDSLKSTLLNFIHESKIDKLFIFNKEKTKFYTTLNTSARIYSHSTSDLIQSLYGVKIDGVWHVYLGENLIAMRDGYKYDKYEPFTWDEISYMAHEQMFGRFIDFDWRGNLKMKPEMVDKYVNPWDIAGTEISQEGTEKEIFLRFTQKQMSNKIDSIEYLHLLDEVNNPEPKVKDPIVTLTWLDKLWGAEEPIFETDEWKEYIKSKNQGK